MAYILFAFSAGIFAFALLAPKESPLNELERPSLASGIALEIDDTPLELDPREVLNFFTVSALFAGAGSLLLFITWKKGKMLRDLDQE